MIKNYQDLESYQKLVPRRRAVFDELVKLFKENNNLITKSNKELSNKVKVPLSTFKKMLIAFEDAKLIKRSNDEATRVEIIDLIEEEPEEEIDEEEDDTGYSLITKAKKKKEIKEIKKIEFICEGREIRPHPSLIIKRLL